MQNRYSNSPFDMPPVVKNLILINIVMMVGTWALNNIGINLTEKLGLFYPTSTYFRPHQLITHIFMHGGFMHLFMNMFALYMFGKVLESVWGSKRFFIYYFVTGLGAAALHLFVNYLEISSIERAATAFANTPTPQLLATFVKSHLHNPNVWVTDFINKWYESPDNPLYIQEGIRITQEVITARIDIPTVGASGAVFGVLLAFGMLFPNTELMLLFPPVPIKAKYFVAGYGLIELYLGITQSNSDIAHFAHLGGMLFGYLLIKYWNSSKKTFY